MVKVQYILMVLNICTCLCDKCFINRFVVVLFVLCFGVTFFVPFVTYDVRFHSFS